jgi:hypothetical protein
MSGSCIASNVVDVGLDRGVTFQPVLRFRELLVYLVKLPLTSLSARFLFEQLLHLDMS